MHPDIYRMNKQQGPNIQYSVITIMEKNMNNSVYTCRTESLCCSSELSIVN